MTRAGHVFGATSVPEHLSLTRFPEVVLTRLVCTGTVLLVFDRSFTNFNEPALAVITAVVKRRNFDTVSLPGGVRASKKIR